MKKYKIIKTVTSVLCGLLKLSSINCVRSTYLTPTSIILFTEVNDREEFTYKHVVLDFSKYKIKLSAYREEIRGIFLLN